MVVFGCGGNRSKLRRYGMGEICAKMADFSILTEDNNRFEKVEDILADIRVGMNKGNPDAKFVEIPDRLDALHYAVDHAQEGDLIAVIGKGHETYRDREGVKTPFLERSCWKNTHSRSGWNKKYYIAGGPLRGTKTAAGFVCGGKAPSKYEDSSAD